MIDNKDGTFEIPQEELELLVEQYVMEKANISADKYVSVHFVIFDSLSAILTVDSYNQKTGSNNFLDIGYYV